VSREIKYTCDCCGNKIENRATKILFATYNCNSIGTSDEPDYYLIRYFCTSCATIKIYDFASEINLK